jgi:GT2 family glycosyltransferase
MALIAMAVYDTKENNRTQFTAATLDTLERTVDWNRHRLIVVDNGSCPETKELLLHHPIVTIQPITLQKNIGTAKAINRAWSRRQDGENVVKMDNDVHIKQRGWADVMEEAIARDPAIGIIGLKRKDLAESPLATHEWYISTLHMVPHAPGQLWIVVEKVNHVFGTCQMYSSKLIEEIGFLYQMDGLYGFDDALASLRANLSGFSTVFLHGFEIDHLDPGGTDYTKWKANYAGQMMDKYHRVAQEYRDETRPLYYPGP